MFRIVNELIKRQVQRDRGKGAQRGRTCQSTKVACRFIGAFKCFDEVGDNGGRGLYMVNGNKGQEGK